MGRASKVLWVWTVPLVACDGPARLHQPEPGPISAQVVDVGVGDLEVTLRYLGAPPTAAGAACDMVAIVWVADRSRGTGGTCDGTSARGLAPGDYLIEVLYTSSDGNPLLGTRTETVAAAATSMVELDVSGVVGVVTGELTVNGEAPPSSGYTVCGETNGRVCQAVIPDSGPPAPDVGVFRLLLPAGAGTGEVFAPSGLRVAQFAFTVMAGESVDAGTMDVGVGDLEVTLRYLGAPPTATGSACGDLVAMVKFPDGSGSGGGCEGTSLSGLVPGDYVIEVSYLTSGGGLLLSSAAAVVAGATTTVTLDVSEVVGEVTGELTVNGEAPRSGYRVCGETSAQVCQDVPGVAPDSGPPIPGVTGVFRLLLPAGAGTGEVFAPSGLRVGAFTFTVTAGQTTDIGGAIHNTPTGTDVAVSVPDQDGNLSGVVVTFADVSASGVTTVTVGEAGPAPPGGFQLGDPPTYYNITTTATFTGVVRVCIDYSGVQFTDEAALALLHREIDPLTGEERWVDRTVSHDLAANIICGDVEMFSLFVVVARTVVTVEIDVKPGDGTNPINLKSEGNVPVAVLGAAGFDVRRIDPATVRFASAAALRRPGLEDVNGDAFLDAVFHFGTRSLQLPDGASEACLSGQTFAGVAFEGCDAVRVRR